MANMGTGNGVRADIFSDTEKMREIIKELEIKVIDKKDLERLRDLLKEIDDKNVE